MNVLNCGKIKLLNFWKLTQRLRFIRYIWQLVFFYRKKTDPELSKDSGELLWKDIMSENIFVNCRTPYAKRIAERVLRGYDKAIDTNISVVDLTEVKKQLES